MITVPGDFDDPEDSSNLDHVVDRDNESDSESNTNYQVINIKANTNPAELFGKYPSDDKDYQSGTDAATIVRSTNELSPTTTDGKNQY